MTDSISQTFRTPITRYTNVCHGPSGPAREGSVLVARTTSHDTSPLPPQGLDRSDSRPPLPASSRALPYALHTCAARASSLTANPRARTACSWQLITVGVADGVMPP